MSKSTSSSSTTDEPELLEVGHVRRPHGVRGDVYVQLTTDVPARAEPGAELFAAGRHLVVERCRVATNGRLIVKFHDVDDRDAAAELTNLALSAVPIDDPERLWVHRLIGADVVEVGGARRGRCVAVIDNPAADLLELDDGALVPLTFVVELRPPSAHGADRGAVSDRAQILIDPPDGLFDL